MTLTLHNEYFTRAFENAATGFRTSAFTAATGEPLIAGLEQADAAVTIDGCRYRLGGDEPHSIPFVSHELAGMPKGNGQRLTVFFAGHRQLPAGIQIRVIYDAPDEVPVLIKSIRIDNDSDMAIRLDHIEVETVSPTDRPHAALLLETDYVRDAITVDGKAVYSPWIEEHHHYVNRLLTVETKPHVFAYPVRIHRWLGYGQRFSSFRAYEYVLENRGMERRGIALREASRRLFPWTNAAELRAMVPYSGNVEAYYEGVASAAEAGFDCVMLRMVFDVGRLTSPLFTNFNDYVINEQLFPGGMDDVRKLTAFAHDHGLKIGFYTIYCQTWQGPYQKGPEAYLCNNWEQVWPFDHAKRQAEAGAKDYRWGQALDPGTDWGLFINRRLEAFIDEAGFDSCMVDGPYYGDVSVADRFRACPAGGPNQVLGWERQSMLYQMALRKGWNIEAAQGYHAYPHGNTRITTTGYVEGDFGAKSIPEQILVNRKAAYLFTYAYRPVQASYYVPVTPYNPQKAEAPSMEPMEEKAGLYDLALGFCFGYGFPGKVFMRRAFEGPKSKAVVQRWLGFWKDHADFFLRGTMVHLREPDGKSLDGIAHVLTDDTPQMLLVAFNPTTEERTEFLDLSPLSAVDLPGDDWHGTDHVGQPVRSQGGVVPITVPALNTGWLKLQLKA